VYPISGRYACLSGVDPFPPGSTHAAIRTGFAEVRPPIEVYSLDPDTKNDRVDLSYRFDAADVIDTVQGHFGQSEDSLPDDRGTSYGRASWGVSNVAEYRSFTLMATFQTVRLTITSPDALLDAFRSFGAQGNAIANQFDDDDKLLVIEQVGASYDSGHWVVASEWCHANTHSFLAIRPPSTAVPAIALANLRPILPIPKSTQLATLVRV